MLFLVFLGKPSVYLLWEGGKKKHRYLVNFYTASLFYGWIIFKTVNNYHHKEAFYLNSSLPHLFFLSTLWHGSYHCYSTLKGTMGHNLVTEKFLGCPSFRILIYTNTHKWTCIRTHSYFLRYILIYQIIKSS